MPAATLAKVPTPVSTYPSMATNNATAVQSGPYTKAQFQSTMEGSRTVKSSKEVEHLLRDYPAALELYQTGKYKVKVKYDVDVERVILVEKRVTKVAANNPTTTTNDTQEKNQTVPDLSTNTEQDKEVKKDEVSRRSRSRTHSQDRVAPTTTVTNGNNLVPTAISSIRMTSNTQPKVDHHRTPSRDREVSVTPPQKQPVHGRSQSRDSQHKASYRIQQGKQINREYPKMMVPFVPNAKNPGNLWQQQRPQQPYFSNPLLQPQRTNLYTPSSFVPQQNPPYRQPYYYGQRPAGPVAYPQQQSAYPSLSARSLGKSSIYSANNYSLSSRSIPNPMGLPPSFRTFHCNPQQTPPFRPMYQSQVPFSMNHPWTNRAEQPVGAMMNNNGGHVEQQRGGKNRAHSVDTGPRNNQSVRPSDIQQQPVSVTEHYHRYRSQPTNKVVPSVENGKEQIVSAKEPTSVVNGEKLTVRQLNENFMQTDPSGRVAYSSLPTIIQHFGITLTENDVISAAKDLEYNVNEPISARRFVHILVKLGKITKSTQQRQPASPSLLPEDREVTDIMTPRKASATHTYLSNQPNQWH